MLPGVTLDAVHRLGLPLHDATQLEAAGMRMSSAPTRLLLLLLLLVLVVALLRRRFENIARVLRLLWRYNRR